jgi:hypothetical protein
MAMSYETKLKFAKAHAPSLTPQELDEFIKGMKGDNLQGLISQAKQFARDVESQKAAGQRRNNYELPGFAGRDAELKGRAYDSMNDQRLAAEQQQVARRGQQSVADILMRQARGQGPSVAEQQLRASTDRNINMSRAMANSASPGQQAMMQRLAMQQAGGANQAAAQQAAQLRAQEQLAATGQLGQVYGGMRAQDQSALGGAQGMEQFSRELALRNAGGQQTGGMNYEGNETQRYGIDQQAKANDSPWWQDLGKTILDAGTAAASLGAKPFSSDAQGLTPQEMQAQVMKKKARRGSY